MAYDMTAWWTVADVRNELAAGNVTVPASITDAYIQARIDATEQYIFQTTRRQFVADTEDVVRVYDGNGTGTMEIDEYRSITSVKFLFFPQVASIDALTWYAVNHVKWPKTRIQIFQGPANAVYALYPNFPLGRSNIEVTGKFGYDDTIPADLWMAGLNQVMATIINVLSLAALDGTAQMNQTLKWTEGYQSEQYNSGTPGDQLGWTKEFKATCRRYCSQVARRVGKGNQQLW